MWNEILGALTILAMIVAGLVLIPAAPKLTDAICDRIRFGIQPPIADDEDLEDDAEEPAAKTPATPVAAATKTAVATKTATATKTAVKPAATRAAA
jgi:hypothetical protein